MYCHVIVAHVSGLLRVNSSLVGDHQMASACKQYITERGHVSVWDVPPEAGCLQETLPVLPGMLQPEQVARAQQPPPV